MNERNGADWCVTATPIEGLWDENGPVQARKISNRTTEQVRQLMREKRVSFVVADVGFPLAWHTGRNAFDFWAKIKTQICDDAESGCNLESFPDGFFFAEQWQLESGEIAILLIHSH